MQCVAELFLPEYMSRIVKKGLVEMGGHLPTIIKYGTIMLVLTLISLTGALISSHFASKISANLAADLREKIFVKVSGYSLGEFDKISASSLITRSTNDISQIQNFTYMLFRIMIRVPVMFFGSVVLTGFKQPQLLWVLTISLPIVTAITVIIAKYIIPLFRAMQRRVDGLTLIAREGLSGVRVIRAFNRQQTQSERFDGANTGVTQTAIKANKIMSAMMPSVTFVLNLSMVGILWLGFKRMQINLTFQTGDLMAVIQYVMHILFSLTMATNLFIMIPRAQTSAKRINEVLDMPISIDGGKGILPQDDSDCGVEFKNVSFRFGGAATCALENVSFKAQKNKVTAIVGSTGSGKSTILDLISRFYDATGGEVLVCGHNVKDYPLSALRHKMGAVPQRAFLFSGTIADNIRYGKQGASDDEIIDALKTAQAYNFVMEKGGLSAYVEQGGANFSGGQRQRLAIARAIVRTNADIFMFDDSFSALDFKTDAALRKALIQKFNDKTIIIVAQRINTVINADNIIVLDQGKAVGSGTHSRLLKSCSVYREIAESQLDEEELKR